MLPDPVCLAALVELTREQHFGRAATSLHVTTSALSKRVRRLERQVGTELVVRGPGGMAGLTPQGEVVALRAKRVLEDLARTQSPPPHGALDVVRLGIPGEPQDHLDHETYRTIAAALRTVHPRARLAVVGVPYGADDTWLLDERVDVMLGLVAPAGRRLAERPLMTVGRIVICPANDPLGQAPALTLDDLDGRRLLTEECAGERWMSPWLLGDVTRLPGRSIRPVRARGGRDLAGYVVAGLGIAVAKDTTLPIAGAHLALVPLTGIPALLLRATYRADDHREQVAALLVVLGILTATVQRAPSSA